MGSNNTEVHKTLKNNIKVKHLNVFCYRFRQE